MTDERKVPSETLPSEALEYYIKHRSPSDDAAMMARELLQLRADLAQQAEPGWKCNYCGKMQTGQDERCCAMPSSWSRVEQAEPVAWVPTDPTLGMQRAFEQAAGYDFNLGFERGYKAMLAAVPEPKP